MSTLISSAVGGKKAAAPKGAVRRRQPPPTAPANAEIPTTITSVQSSLAPPSPPPTQAPESAVIQTTENDISTDSRAPSQPAESSPTFVSTSHATRKPTTPEPSQRPAVDSSAKTAMSSNLVISEDVDHASVVASTASRKRKQGVEGTKETTAPAKRVKRSSARSSGKVQAAAQEDPPIEPSLLNASLPATSEMHPMEPSEEASAPPVHTKNTRSNKQVAKARFELTPSASTRKRQQEQENEAPQAQAPKRVKRSSARSNGAVQTVVQQEQAPSVTTAGASKASKIVKTRAQKSIVTPDATAIDRGDMTKDRSKSQKVSPLAKTQARQKDSSTSTQPSLKQNNAAKTKQAPLNTKDSTSAPRSAAKRRSKQQAAATMPTEDVGEHSTAEQAQPKRKRKPRPRKKVQPPRSDERDGGQEAQDEEIEDDSDFSDPEFHEIDPNTVTMWEVGGDKRHGKTSERERKMATIDWDEVTRLQREEAEKIRAGEHIPVPAPAPATDDTDAIGTMEGPDGTAESQAPEQEEDAEEGEPPQLVLGPDGEIMEDERNLQIDRHQRIADEIAAKNDEPVIEDTDLTKRINRTTYLNVRKRDPTERVPMWKAKSDAWNDEQTDRFYDALRMFGTDFFIISKMFHPKTRRQIKMKFVREERLDPIRVDRALGGGERKEIDLEHYARETGREVEEFTKFDNLEAAQAEIREDFRELEEANELARKEQQAAEDAAREEDGRREKDKENATAKKTKRAPKNKAEREGGKGKAKTGGKGKTAGGKPKDGEGGKKGPKKAGTAKVGRPRKNKKGADADAATTGTTTAPAADEAPKE